MNSGPVTSARVDVVFPCLNEAEALPWILGRLPDGYRAIVVDNGSTDGSAAVARAHGALVIDQPVRGFGSAAHTGLLAATAPIVAFCDADASMDPCDLPRVVDPVIAGGTDLVLGRRRPTSRAAWRCTPASQIGLSPFSCDGQRVSNCTTSVLCARRGERP